jgi:hypothetical protein
MKFLFFLLVPALCFAELKKKEVSEFTATGIKDFVVKNGRGDIKVIENKDAKIVIEGTKLSANPACKIEIEKDDEELEVSVENDDSKKDCEINFLVSIPKGVNLEVKNGSGNVEIKNFKGELDLAVGSGNSQIEGEILKIDAKAGSGNIVAKGLAGEAEFKLGSGNLNVEYAKVVDDTELDIKTGSGNALVKLHKEQKLTTSFWAASGKLINKLGETDNAKFSVSMKSGSGNLEIVTK